MRVVRVQTEYPVYGVLQADGTVQPWTQAPWLGGRPAAGCIPADGYRLLAPCEPSKIVAVGRNYRDHAAEMGAEVPQEPLLFLKPPTTVIGPGETIRCPPESRRVDYEGELALVIGRPCRRAAPDVAQTCIWGYTLANDVTARDLQKSDGQWTRAKGFDTFCPLGPWVVPMLEPGAQLTTELNGRIVQSAGLDQMVFSPPVLVSYISQVMTLLPGDVVLTGTPAGIGPLTAGDQVRVGLTGLGSLISTVA
ncbi:MAG: fumarylacetoacetate hydrolase family protein [Gloeomargaritaceae cyanobacterium C42_A2020_066]|nr:fumarylacetoacetate hydrolase family protein [Gloeomargaritaceae cyanobacterium C42_A2020_066]